MEAVLLIDMDGAYISAEAIEKNDGYDRPFYDVDKIMCQAPDRLLKTHVQKQMNLNRLISLPIVCRIIPFSVYFFSCNLDHVISGNANLSRNEKSIAAERFRHKYHSDLAGFISFFYDKIIAVGNTYDDSWSYIRKDSNSLKRGSNLNIFLSSAAVRIQRDFSGILKSISSGENDNGKRKLTK